MSSRPIATTRSVMEVPTGRLAIWWVLASETVLFGGLLGSYVMMRLRHGAWADAAANTNTWAGAFNTLVLLTSSLAAVLAHQAAERADGPKAARLLRFAGLSVLRFAQCTLLRLATLPGFPSLALLMRRLLSDPVLLQVHQFFQ